MSNLLALLAISLVPIAMGWYPCHCPTGQAEDDCTYCNANTTRQQMQVVLPNDWIDKQCTDCDLSGTYILEHDGGAACSWQYNLSNCSGAIVIFTISSGQLGVSVQVTKDCVNYGHGESSTYDVSFTTPADCDTISETLSWNNTTSFGQQCGGLPLTVEYNVCHNTGESTVDVDSL